MGRFLIRRLLQLLAVLLAVSAIVFFALRLGPFDPAAQAYEATLGDPARIAELKAYWGLDKPLVEQYAKYLWGVSHGDLGKSLQDLQPVTRALGERYPATIELAIVSTLIGTFLGLLAGVLAASRPNSWIDLGGRSAALVGISFPTFWLGVMGIAVFAVKLQWLPSGGRFSEDVEFEPMTGFYLIDGIIQGRPDVLLTTLEHLILPSAVLGLLVAGLVTRITRASVLDALGKDYVRTAVAKGAKRSRIVVLHALPNAMLPIITVIGLMFGLLLSGAVIVETVFAYPGIGRLLVDSISVRDFPQVQACILVLAATYSLINAAADVLYVVVDPRVKLE